MQKFLNAGLLATFLALPLPASALCALCTCTVTATPVAFGVFSPTSSTPLDSDGTVLLTCGGLVGGLITYDITLGKGANASSFIPRKMASGANRLNYNLYTTSAYSTIWGDGTAGTQTMSGSITILLLAGTSRSLTVYGRLPGSQSNVRAGAYSDAVLVTVSYN